MKKLIPITIITLIFILGCATTPPTEPRNPKYEPIVGESLPTLTNSPYPVKHHSRQVEDGRIILIIFWASAEFHEITYITVQIDGVGGFYQVVDIKQNRLYVDNNGDGFVDEIFNDISSNSNIGPSYGIPPKGKKI
jgi:hypothetical protein